MFGKPDIVACSGNSNSWETEEEGHLGLHSEFQSSEDHNMKLCLKIKEEREWRGSEGRGDREKKKENQK